MSRRVRITEKSNSVATEDSRYIWDGAEIVERRAANGTTWEQRYYAEGFVDATEGDFFYTRDHLGSIREVVADDGVTVESQYDYGIWGEVERIAGLGIGSPFRYTGHFYHAPSELHLTWFRAYDADPGRWLSRDPIGIAGGLNLYGYVENGPIIWADPLGLELFDITIEAPGTEKDRWDIQGPDYGPPAEEFWNQPRPLGDSLRQIAIQAQDGARNCAANTVGAVGDLADLADRAAGPILQAGAMASEAYLNSGSPLYVAARVPVIGPKIAGLSSAGALGVMMLDAFASSGDFFQSLEEAIRQDGQDCN